MTFKPGQSVAVYVESRGRPTFEGRAIVRSELGDGRYRVEFAGEPGILHDRLIEDDAIAQTDPEAYLTKLRRALQSASRVTDPRVFLIQQSHLETLFQLAGARNGFFQLINRALLPVTETVVVAFYEKPKSGAASPVSARFVAHTFFDLMLGARFEGRMNEELAKLDLDGCGDHRELTEKQLESAFQIFGTDYYCTAWSISTADSADVDFKVLQIAKDSDTPVAITFRRVFEPVLPLIENDHEIAKALAAMKASDHYNKPDLRARKLLRPRKSSIDVLPRALPATPSCGKPLEKWSLPNILDEIYERYNKSSILNGTPDARCPVPNILFFYRSHDRTTLRCGSYDYSARCILPPRQFDDLGKALEEWSPVLRTVTPREMVWPHDRVSEGEDWDKAERLVTEHLATAKGRRFILETIGGPDSDVERSFFEYPLSSGIYNVRRDIFRQGRVFNIATDAARQNQSGADAARFRDACFRRVMLLMVPWVDGRPKLGNARARYSVVQAPVRLGGCPAAVFAAVRQDAPDGHLGDRAVEGAAFEFTWHFYHSITKPAIRRFRTKARNGYIDAVADVVSEALMAAWQQRSRKNLTVFLREVNAALADLSRVFPYRRVQLYRAFGDMRDAEPGEFVSRPIWLKRTSDGGAFGFIVKLDDNQFYTRFGGSYFIKAEPIEERISHKIMLAVQQRISRLSGQAE